MTPSEAFAALIDGKRVEVRMLAPRADEWRKVARFRLETHGLTVEYDNTVDLLHGDATNRDYRLKDAAPEPAPVSPYNDTAVAYRAGQADSDAWWLLLELEDALSKQTLDGAPIQYSIRTNTIRRRVRDAIKKAGKL